MHKKLTIDEEYKSRLLKETEAFMKAIGIIKDGLENGTEAQQMISATRLRATLATVVVLFPALNDAVHAGITLAGEYFDPASDEHAHKWIDKQLLEGYCHPLYNGIDKHAHETCRHCGDTHAGAKEVNQALHRIQEQMNELLAADDISDEDKEEVSKLQSALQKLSCVGVH